MSLVLIVTSTNCCRHTEGLSVTEVGRVEVVVTADQNREKTKSCPKSLRRSRGNRGSTPAVPACERRPAASSLVVVVERC